MPDEHHADAVQAWLEALERRHLADLTFPEVARALRALSSCYVERRSRLASGGALDTRGKRAAFALFYGPLHLLLLRQLIRALEWGRPGIPRLLDLGCGTGAAGAACALETVCRHVQGIDRHPWALAEANWTYTHFRISGRAAPGSLERHVKQVSSGSGILAAYVVNELPAAPRDALLQELRAARHRGARILIVEPIATRTTPWWRQWVRAAGEAGGRADEWRFPASLPPLQDRLARAAGLQPRELTARSISW